jgi:gluconolactonase
LSVPGATLAIGRNQPPEYRGGSIQTVDVSSGELRKLYSACYGNPLRARNDLVFDRHGGFFFTDSGKRPDRDADFGGLYYAKADGSEISELVFLDARQWAGPVACGRSGVSGRDRQWPNLVVGDRVPRGAQARQWTCSCGCELLHAMPVYQVIDSLAVEANGNICVATRFVGAITVSLDGADQRMVDKAE